MEGGWEYPQQGTWLAHAAPAEGGRSGDVSRLTWLRFFNPSALRQLQTRLSFAVEPVIALLALRLPGYSERDLTRPH